MIQPNLAAKPAARVRKMAREPRTEPDLGQQFDRSNGASDATVAEPLVMPVPKAKEPSKVDLLLALLRRDQGATLENLITATGWLPHTTRAALTGIKRKGHILSSEKVDGVRTYRVATQGAGS